MAYPDSLGKIIDAFLDYEYVSTIAKRTERRSERNRKYERSMSFENNRKIGRYRYRYIEYREEVFQMPCLLCICPRSPFLQNYQMFST